jgi:hypothetical protein
MTISIPDELKKAIAAKKVGVFVGAGVSRASGLPSWNGLLVELINKLKAIPATDARLVKDLQNLAKDPARYLMAASILREELGSEFDKYIESRFASDTLVPSSLHKAIIELPAAFIITTNYDNLLERAYLEKHNGKSMPIVYTYKQPGEVASSLHRGKYFFLKAHGDAQTNPSQVVLTEKDYRGTIHHEPGYQSLLQTLFTTFTILFVGCSFTDIELLLLLGFIHSSFHGKTPEHYAIQSGTTTNVTVAKSWRHDYNIHVLEVSSNSDHKEVLELVRALGNPNESSAKPRRRK